MVAGRSGCCHPRILFFVSSELRFCSLVSFLDLAGGDVGGLDGDMVLSVRLDFVVVIGGGCLGFFQKFDALRQLKVEEGGLKCRRRKFGCWQ